MFLGSVPRSAPNGEETSTVVRADEELNIALAASAEVVDFCRRFGVDHIFALGTGVIQDLEDWYRTGSCR